MSYSKKNRESFNNIKNVIYKDNNFSTRYDFQELAEILTKTDLSDKEIGSLEALNMYVNNIKYSVEDLGSKIVDATTVDFSNKIRLESFVRDIITIIDEFIDSLIAIMNTIEFDENRINVQISLSRLTSLRDSLIRKMNEYSRRSSGITLSKDQAKFMNILLTDIIDSIIRESFQLRIQKLSEALGRKLKND